MYFTKPNLFKWLGIAVAAGVVIGIAIGLGIALFMLMNILNMDMIMPGVPIVLPGLSA